jgi:hypothetical protein
MRRVGLQHSQTEPAAVVRGRVELKVFHKALDPRHQQREKDER